MPKLCLCAPEAGSGVVLQCTILLLKRTVAHCKLLSERLGVRFVHANKKQVLYFSIVFKVVWFSPVTVGSNPLLFFFFFSTHIRS